QAAGELAGLAAVCGPVVLAVDVGDQHHVIVAGHGPGALHRVVGNTHPVGHHDQAGAQVVVFIVIDEPAAEGVIADLPFQRFGLHRGGDRGRVQGGGKQGGHDDGTVHGRTPYGKRAA